MRVSQILTRLRDRLDEATANIYTDVELVRYVDEAIRDVFRLQVQHDESYHNCEVDLTNSADGTQLHTKTYLYDVPSWVHRITSVRVASGATAVRNNNIPARTLHNREGSFWAWHGLNRIIVHGAKADDDLTLEVSKVPAPLNAGTLVAPPSLTFSTTQIHWDQASSTEGQYENEFEANWYQNALFEFTGVDTAAHGIAGELVRCSISASVYDTDSPFTTVVFDSAMGTTPVAGDTWEMHAEVPSASIAYVIALAAHKALIRKSNFEAIAALSADLERERNRFIEAVTPRQDQILNFAGMANDALYEDDPDRDRGW